MNITFRERLFMHFDRLLLSVVAMRLSHFRRIGDQADQLADKLARTVHAEIGRRNRMLEGWEREHLAKREAESHAARHAMAMERFKDFERDQNMQNALKLQ